MLSRPRFIWDIGRVGGEPRKHGAPRVAANRTMNQAPTPTAEELSVDSCVQAPSKNQIP